MKFLVSLEIRDLSECFSTAFVVAFIRLFSRMDTDVFLKRAVLGELFATRFERTFIVHFLASFFKLFLNSSLLLNKFVHARNGYGMVVMLLLCVHTAGTDVQAETKMNDDEYNIFKYEDDG